MTNQKRLPIKFTYNTALALIAILLYLLFGLINPLFFSTGTIVDTIKLTAEIGIMALPLTMLIIMGCIDFSMCAILTLSSSIGGMVAHATTPLLGLAVTLLIGLLCGTFNGFMVAKLKLPPLISTLATMYLFRGITQGAVLGTGYGTNVAATSIALFFGSGRILGIITQLWIFLLLATTIHITLSRTSYGRTLYAIGLNENAARFSGIDTIKTKQMTYMFSGVIFAIAGLVLSGRFSTIQYDSADPYLMQVIIACVLGGASISGGRGTILGTVLGVSIIGILKGGMNIILLPQTQQRIILGIVLLISLITFELLNRRELQLRGKERLLASSKQSR
jgi:ribose/xylose/arabinose/galactoside ABC-type transport system permease subunit